MGRGEVRNEAERRNLAPISPQKSCQKRADALRLPWLWKDLLQPAVFECEGHKPRPAGPLGLRVGGEKDTPGLRCRYNLDVVQLSSMCKVAHTAFGVEGKTHAPQLVRASGPKYREGQRDGEV